MTRRRAVPAPADAGALHRRGLAAARQGQLAEAIALLGQAIARDPTHAAAHNDLGVALEATGRLEAAVGAYRHAVAARPDFASAHYNLGRALQALHHDAEAEAHYRRVIALTPDFADVHSNLGALLASRGRDDEALACFRRAVATQPRNAGAHHNLGLMHARLQRWEDAIAAYRQVLALEPSHAEAQLNVGNALLALKRRDEAVVHLEQACARAPNNAWAQISLGDALFGLRRETAALACYERAVALDPALADAHNRLSMALLALGRIEQARDAAESAVALAPGRIDFYAALVDSTRFTPDDPHLARLEALARAPIERPDSERISLNFALAKAYADIGAPARAFEQLLAANALCRRAIAYDEAATLDWLDRVRSVFSDGLMRRHQGRGAAAPQPVFIIGMPRSGTTLVEQILASHPAVFGAGELEDFRELVAQLTGPGGTPLAFPEVAAVLDAAQLRRLGEAYVARVRALAPQAARIVDKLPFNFVNAGLIHLALPNARIIHLRRDPVDTCLSCFGRQFVGDHPYSYDLAELGRYYRGYEAVMAHWRQVLPAGVMLEVRYEDVVDHLEREARRLVAHCGLAWDDAGLHFHESDRPVRTASVAQVRRPIYRSSVARWRAYAHLLTPLLEALGVDPADATAAPR